MDKLNATGVSGDLAELLKNPDKVPVEIFFFKDGTVKVGLGGGPAKELKDHRERQFWLAVLTRMKAQREDKAR